MTSTCSDPRLDISVFVLSYRRPLYLREAVRSVLAQSRKPKSIVILDNGSGEDVKRAVRDFLRQGVCWEGSESVHSSLWNIDRAFRKANLKYACVMHDDDRLCPGFLEAQVRFLEEHANAVAVACGAHMIDSQGRPIGILQDLAGANAVRWFASSADVVELYSKGGFLPFPTLVYRSGCIGRVRIRYEFGKVADVVLLCELADIGPIAYQNTRLYEYRVHAGQDSLDFPEHVRWKLDHFLTTKVSGIPSLAKVVHRDICRTETIRTLVWWLDAVTGKSPRSLIRGVRLISGPYFSWRVALGFAIEQLRRMAARERTTWKGDRTQKESGKEQDRTW